MTMQNIHEQETNKNTSLHAVVNILHRNAIHRIRNIIHWKLRAIASLPVNCLNGKQINAGARAKKEKEKKIITEKVDTTSLKVIR